MRSSLLLRVLSTLLLIAVVGFPALEPPTVQAGPALGRMPGGAVSTGALAAPAASDEADDTTEPDERLIVRFRPHAAQADQVSSHRAAGARRATALALADTVRVDVKQRERDRALVAYNARADVLYAEPDYRVQALYAPNDPRYPDQWGLQKVGASSAWEVTRGASTVRVAVAVIGVPHPKWMERPLACVVPRPEHRASLTPAELIEFLRPRVARFWLPDEIVFVDEIPKTSVGKLDKKALRARFSERLTDQPVAMQVTQTT